MGDDTFWLEAEQVVKIRLIQVELVIRALIEDVDQHPEPHQACIGASMPLVFVSKALWIHVRRHLQDAEALLGPVNEGLVPAAIGVVDMPVVVQQILDEAGGDRPARLPYPRIVDPVYVAPRPKKTPANRSVVRVA